MNRTESNQHSLVIMQWMFADKFGIAEGICHYLSVCH